MSNAGVTALLIAFNMYLCSGQVNHGHLMPVQINPPAVDRQTLGKKVHCIVLCGPSVSFVNSQQNLICNRTYFSNAMIIAKNATHYITLIL